MKQSNTLKLTATNIISTLKTIIDDSEGRPRVEVAYVKVIEETISALTKEYCDDVDPLVASMMESVHKKEVTKEKLLEERYGLYSTLKVTDIEREKENCEKRVEELTKKINTLDEAITKLNSKIQSEQTKEFKFTSKAAKETFETLKEMLSIDYNVIQFRDRRIFSFEAMFAGNARVTFSSARSAQFISYFTRTDNRVFPFVQRIVDAVLADYPLDGAGYIFDANDKNAKSEAIERFAKGIDTQCGKGAFAAYFLYPELYNEKEYPVKRTFVIGTDSDTGKTLMIRLAKALYGPLSKVAMPRPTASDSGYDKGLVDWNNTNKDVVMLLIDDDNQDGRSRADFYKNIYNPEGMQIGNRGKANEYVQFRGNINVNLNALDPSFTEKQVQKRLYFLHLIVPANMYMARHELAEIGAYDEYSDADALINYLNAHREDAKAWLDNYKTPDVLNTKSAEAHEKEREDAIQHRDILEFIDARLTENNSGKMRLATVKKEFHGEINVTKKLVNKIGNGYYICEQMRIPVGDGESVSTSGIKVSVDGETGKIKDPIVTLNEKIKELSDIRESVSVEEMLNNINNALNSVEDVVETKAEALPDVATVKAPEVKTIEKADTLDEFVEASDKRMKESVTIEASDTVKLFANVKQIEKTELTAVKVGDVVAVFADETTDEKEVGTYLSEISGQAIEAVESVEVNADTVVTLVNNGKETTDGWLDNKASIDSINPFGHQMTMFEKVVSELESLTIVTSSTDMTEDIPW